MLIQDIFENAKDCVRLYRGDSSKIKSFDRSKTNTFALFGQGIYLTDNKRVAGDYTSKSNDNDVIYRTVGKTKQEVLDKYLNQIASTIDHNGNDLSNKIEYWGSSVPFSNGSSWSTKGMKKNEEEYKKRLEYAKQAWNKISKNYEIRIKLDGTAVIQKKSNVSESQISEFDVPQSYMKKLFHADDPINDKILDKLLYVLKKNNDIATANDINRYVRDEQKEYGVNPSYRTIFINIGADSPLSDREVQDQFIESLEDMGYVGIEYTGGMSMGGGYKHRAYVFWNSEQLNKFKVNK